jgi:RNA polymerase sigma-70 factor (ECF subfamily)
MTSAGPGPDPSEVPDRLLVARCRDGDPAAWSLLVRRHSRYVHAIAVRVYRLAPDDAEDVFQEVFARAFEHLDHLRDDGAVLPWLGQLARRLCIDRLRAGARSTPGLEAADVDRLATASDDGTDLDEALTVRAALAALPPAGREILDRFFARDESYRTIAEALDIPVGTVASRISRALAALRTELEEAQGKPMAGRA